MCPWDGVLARRLLGNWGAAEEPEVRHWTVTVVGLISETMVGQKLASEVDVLVLSAHPALMAGSVVSGVIHKAVGKELEKADKVFAPIKQGESFEMPDNGAEFFE